MGMAMSYLQSLSNLSLQSLDFEIRYKIYVIKVSRSKKTTTKIKFNYIFTDCNEKYFYIAWSGIEMLFPMWNYGIMKQDPVVIFHGTSIPSPSDLKEALLSPLRSGYTASKLHWTWE